jgi:hypothetical protein
LKLNATPPDVETRAIIARRCMNLCCRRRALNSFIRKYPGIKEMEVDSFKTIAQECKTKKRDFLVGRISFDVFHLN